MTPIILLIEDDENDVLFLQMALKKAGVTFPLQVVKDGQEALHYISGTGKFSDRDKHPVPYLVLLDLKLPYCPGLEILKEIRERSDFDWTVVLVLTSSRDPSDIETAYRLRANAYLVKPSGMDSLQVLAQSVKDFWLMQNQRSSAFM